MSERLFIRLYLDEDVHVLVGDVVSGYGFDAETTRDAERLGASDANQLTYAAKNQRALLTHNRLDFEQLAAQYVAQGRAHYGVIIATRRPPYAIAKRVLHILSYVTADEMRNQVRYI